MVIFQRGKNHCTKSDDVFTFSVREKLVRDVEGKVIIHTQLARIYP